MGCGSHRSHGSHGNFCWWEISQNYVGRSHTESTDSTKIIIRDIRGIRVFFCLPQIITNFHKFRALGALGVIWHSNYHQPLWDLTPSKAKPVGSVRSVWAPNKNRLLIAEINSLCGYSERVQYPIFSRKYKNTKVSIIQNINDLWNRRFSLDLIKKHLFC